MTRIRPRFRFAFARPAFLLLAIALLAAPIVIAGDALPWSDEHGTGEPTIVLLHGLGANRHVWSLVAPQLARTRRVVLVELPGHGESPPLRTVSVKEAARAVDRVLEARRVERALLVGHSYGGWVALEEALAKPKRAAGVVVLDMGAFSPADTARISALESHLTERYPSLIQVIFKAMSELPTEGDSAVAEALRVPPDVMRAYFRDAWRADLRPRLRNLKTPLHVVATPATWPAGQPWEAVRDRLGYATKGPVTGHRVEGSGHLIMRDQPEALVAVIDSIARATAAGAASKRGAKPR
ncbi:MAG TPA: alpha/beta hydrolase [Candidatus Eisenbacteria bacterium]|nr:alpha/beta hydrolase [Candidatus Eisenbacteria bacterium]